MATLPQVWGGALQLWPFYNVVPLLHAGRAALHMYAYGNVSSLGGCPGSAAAKAASQRAAQQAALDAERAKAQEQQRLARLVRALHRYRLSCLLWPYNIAASVAASHD